jgi:hypothetical protein
MAARGTDSREEKAGDSPLLLVSENEKKTEMIKKNFAIFLIC